MRDAEKIDQDFRSVLRSLIAGEKPWPLFLWGNAGVGKTCAALVLLDYAGGKYFTVRSLCDQLIQSQQGRLEWYHLGMGGKVWPEQFWQIVRDAPLVVIDEAGTRENVSDHQYENFKQVIDDRHGKPTVVISNHDLGKIGELYDSRIASRLAQGTVVHLKGEDRRLSEQS